MVRTRKKSYFRETTLTDQSATIDIPTDMTTMTTTNDVEAAITGTDIVGKHVPPDGTGWNRMQDAENRLIAEPAPIGTEPIGRTEM